MAGGSAKAKKLKDRMGHDLPGVADKQKPGRLELMKGEKVNGSEVIR